MKYARIQDNVVAEIIIPPEGVSIHDMFHPDLVKTFVDIGDSAITCGLGFDPDNGGWAAPIEPDPVE